MDNLKIAFQYALPKHLISKLVGYLAAAPLGPVTQLFIKLFIKAYKIDMTEAEHSDPKAYRTFNEFFTRPLRANVRTFVEQDNEIAYPVDGKVSQLGPIENGTLIQAKNHYYDLLEVVGGDQAIADKFMGGDFATIYLAPSDYHRIHMPMAGKLTDMVYVPGDAFSVNPLTAENVPNLFARNERVVCVFETEIGPMAMILVGATIVRSIETIWAGTVTPPRGPAVNHWKYEGDEQIELALGAEMGRFKLGSTVICLFPKDAMKFADDVKAGTVTRLGGLFANSTVTPTDTESDAKE